MRLLTLALILPVIILNLSGCVSAPKELSVARDLRPSEVLKFHDVPIPVGFKILPEKSFILESVGMRAGVLRYTGKANIENVVNFYKKQMPVYNWALLNVLEYGERMLNYERDNEGCVINIKPRGATIDISISLAPKSPIPAPKQKILPKEPIGVELKK
ncbi:MAG: hypothetical protein PVI33_02010 [Candidatus Omnitrophota bacterium]|jgi:hypothetical protein